MKKILSLIIVLTLVFSMLTSCSLADILFIIIDQEIQDQLGDLELPDDLTPDDDDDDDDVKNDKYLYTSFTSAEKSLFIDYFGEVIPFAQNNDYYLEEYEYDYGDEYEYGLNFYAYDLTRAEFNSYKALFSSYTFDGTDVDEYGDTWYLYSSDKGFYIDLCYYHDGEDYVRDLYVYYLTDSDGGNGGNGGNGGDGGNSGVAPEVDGLITNEGAGLPTGTGGVHKVDFTKADKVKDVTDQGYYLDGCPTVGKVPVLVIPIEFSDITAQSKGYSIDTIKRAFSGSDTDYFSVEEYYYTSSYGQLDLDFTVVNQWFKPQRNSSYYENLYDSYLGENIFIGDQVILDEALAFLSGSMDLSKFDSDGNGVIDAVVMINTLEVDSESDFHWAYRYWNSYTDDEGYYYEYDRVSANDYIWAPYGFMHESLSSDGEYEYTDSSVMNTYTYIHEFGHILGADDYYDSEYNDETPLDGCDIMDGMAGDHNPYTKFNLGWITSSRLVTASSSLTLTLESFTKTGDSIIIANNFNEKLGVYQEYYVVVYYTKTGLNGGDYGYFSREGVIVYHVNASLYSEEIDGDVYYDVYNNNTAYTDEYGYGTYDNLIEFVKSAEGNFTYVEGDSLPTLTDDLGNRLGYTFTVDSIENGKATLIFTKK